MWCSSAVKRVHDFKKNMNPSLQLHHRHHIIIIIIIITFIVSEKSVQNLTANTNTRNTDTTAT